MSFFETEETRRLSFEAFAAHPFYTAINRSLVQRALAHVVTRTPDAPLTIVDMACGTGAATRLIAEELARRGRRVRIIAVDPSADALRLAQRRNEEMGIEASFFEGVADELPTLVREKSSLQ
jgi:ubiquinone/menaquinone biosynthesis C-methylase UbiE